MIDNIDATYNHLKHHSHKLIIDLVYWPPVQTHKIDDRLHLYSKQIADMCCHDHSVIFGDFNLLVSK